jgi:PilZ domain
MSQPSRNVLAIGVSQEEFDRLVPFLARQSFDVDRFPSALGALELIGQVAFELLLVRFPLPGMEIRRFLTEVRRPGGPCQRSSLLVLSPAERLPDASAYIGFGANRAISLEASEGEVQQTVSSVLDVAPRKAARFMIRLEIKLGGAKDLLLCQTENISASGLLIRSDKRYELGTELDFEFTLPTDHRPVAGVAEIVRFTDLGREQGVGLRFLSFSGDSQRRFESFLRSR